MKQKTETLIDQAQEALANAKKDLIFLDVYVNALQRQISEKECRRMYEKHDDYINARKSAKKTVALTSAVCICVFCMIAVAVFVGINYDRYSGGEIAVPFAVGIFFGGCAGLTAYLTERRKLIKTAEKIVDECNEDLNRQRSACNILIENRKAEIHDLEVEIIDLKGQAASE